MGTFYISHKILAVTTTVLVLSLSIITVTFGNGKGPGGSTCPGTTCASGPAGHSCEAKYERSNTCCPVWYCRDHNGIVTTHYGVSSGSGGSMVQSVSSSSGGAPPGNNLLAGLANMFANMFG